eukprot:CAMPEP_0201481214 /NCGR_PEP_ID=MMETSP0151_2-20130828/5512_1 /ASSEMBLY_ACC=CAM_ASM_000257 /TAXON_ID=200890 /ORGANISM="Paramoeba atlantica, Strain 621/1 / CCAP 1560/9" /LENGTH=84 /DNA_ID=CAMNT_0047863299 /DNA_START=795 /DNA_END=1046 /DNA_ORIENTATION=+
MTLEFYGMMAQLLVQFAKFGGVDYRGKLLSFEEKVQFSSKLLSTFGNENHLPNLLQETQERFDQSHTKFRHHQIQHYQKSVKSG